MANLIDFNESEVVIALIGAIGTDLTRVIEPLTNKLNSYEYNVENIRVSKDIIEPLYKMHPIPLGSFGKISFFMDNGNKVRKLTNDNAVLANGIAYQINKIRTSKNNDNESRPLPNTAFLINSIKTPEEIQRLREIYQTGFYAISVYSDRDRRKNNLIRKNMTEDQANTLIARDEDESDDFGQHTRDSFHLSDFFVNYDGDEDNIINSIDRIVDIIFGDPYKTPTFDEFAMFMAFSSALRSADLSRQVGAVVSKEDTIVSTGSNDVPKFGGGVYWPTTDEKGRVNDYEKGRDYKRGFDSNSQEKQDIIEGILASVNHLDSQTLDEIRSSLSKSRIKDITEYGRVVHAEMDALLNCARNGIGTKGVSLYCTTFPCHNCAKHIIASGVKRVVYIEPYPKSKALDFHSESVIATSNVVSQDKVYFEPFVGVGPRRFFDLFSMHMSEGFSLRRKSKSGEIIKWPDSKSPPLRMQMYPFNYIDKETLAVSKFDDIINQVQAGDSNE